MIFRNRGRSTPDQVFLLVQNVGSRTLEIGELAFLNAENRPNGYAVREYDSSYTATGWAVGVVAEAAILQGQFGVVQCYGHCRYILFYNGSIPTTTSQEVALLVPDEDTTGRWKRATYSTNSFEAGHWLGGFVVPGETITTDFGTIKGFIKCM